MQFLETLDDNAFPLEKHHCTIVILSNFYGESGAFKARDYNKVK